MRRATVFTALIVWSAMASAVVYKWTDADGRVHYGDQPPDGVKAEVVEMLGTHATATAAAPPAPRASAPAAPASAAQAKDGASHSDPGDAAAARAQQCDEAKQRLKQLTDGRHLYQVDANGQRQYMTSDQIDSQRSDAKQEVDQICSAQ